MRHAKAKQSPVLPKSWWQNLDGGSRVFEEAINVSWQHENSTVSARAVHMHASRKVRQYWQYLPTTSTLSNVSATLSPLRSNSVYATLSSTFVFAQHIKIKSRSLKHRCTLALTEHNAHAFLLHIEDPVSGQGRRVILFLVPREARATSKNHSALPTWQAMSTCLPASAVFRVHCVAGEALNNFNDSINTAEESLAGKAQKHKRTGDLTPAEEKTTAQESLGL